MTPVTSGFLTRDEFVKVYDKCAALLHAENPYGSKPDYGYFDKQIPLWAQRTARLLDRHTIQLADSDIRYLIHMREVDGQVHHYTLTPPDVPNY